MTMERLASSRTAFPLSNLTTYQSSNVSQHIFSLLPFSLIRTLSSCMAQSSAARDSQKIVACVCESSWPVGLSANQTQQAEWFGPDCFMRECRCCYLRTLLVFTYNNLLIISGLSCILCLCMHCWLEPQH